MMEQRCKILEMGEHVLRFEDGDEMEDFFINKAEKELRETPAVRDEAIRELKKRLADTEEITWNFDDDTLCLCYLRPCKFYVDSAYKKLIDFLNFKEKNNKYFGNISPKTDFKAFFSDIFTVLPYRDQHGRRMLVLEIGSKWDTKKLNLDEIVRCLIIIVEAATLEPKTQIAGANVILDLNSLSINHVWQFTPGFAKLMLGYVQEHMPIRLKSLHIVNQPYLFNMLYSIFKPFILPKLRERIFFHGSSMTTLVEHIDPKFLPKQYGGVYDLEFKYGEELYNLVKLYQDKFDTYNSRYLAPKKKAEKKK